VARRKHVEAERFRTVSAPVKPTLPKAAAAPDMTLGAQAGRTAAARKGRGRAR
jgi:hypothetical protein